MDYKSRIEWEYYHPVDREIWMPTVILINIDKYRRRKMTKTAQGRNEKIIKQIAANYAEAENAK